MNHWSAAPPMPGPSSRLLLVLFLLGIYLGVPLNLPGGIPVPAVLAGAAGGLLLLMHMRRIRERDIVVLVAILVLYALSILSAAEYEFLGERFKGFVQLTYSLLLGYGFYFAATEFPREHLAKVFLAFCLAILVGCALENYTPLKTVSDTFRGWVFDSSGIYNSDLRDLLLYGRIRPKLFTSEPSAVTFFFTLYGFAWYVLSRARLKMAGYLAMLTVGYFLLRGPTLLLGAALIPAYELLLAARQGPAWAGRVDVSRALAAVGLTILMAVGMLFLGASLYAERIEAIFAGQDPSFFGRVVAPPLTAISVIAEHPFAGAGLTGWEFIEEAAQMVYATSEAFSASFAFESAAHAITNYFWLHWIFLGLFWGTVLFVALTWLLRTLGTPSILFCWTVWAVFGQSAGSYVGPQTWMVFFMACAIAILHERERAPHGYVHGYGYVGPVQADGAAARPVALLTYGRREPHLPMAPEGR